jgi:hypothetical protein
MLRKNNYRIEADGKKGKQYDACNNKFFCERFEKSHEPTMKRLCIRISIITASSCN